MPRSTIQRVDGVRRVSACAVVLGNRLAGCDVCPDRAEHEQDTQTAEKPHTFFHPVLPMFDWQVREVSEKVSAYEPLRMRYLTL